MGDDDIIIIWIATDYRIYLKHLTGFPHLIHSDSMNLIINCKLLRRNFIGTVTKFTLTLSSFSSRIKIGALYISRTSMKRVRFLSSVNLVTLETLWPQRLEYFRNFNEMIEDPFKYIMSNARNIVSSRIGSVICLFVIEIITYLNW